MKARSALLCLCLVISLTTLISHKRISIEDDLFAKMNAYFSENVSFGLYVHSDKNIYVPGEIIWFKAYLTGDTTLQNEVLYVRLVDQNNQPVMKKEFAMYDVRAHGNITLPDDLTEGKYRLYAYTDKMINFSPREVFNREITVVDNSSIALEATAFLADTAALSQGKDVAVVCKLSRDGVSIADAKCHYMLSDTSDNILAEGRINTNNIGGAIFTLPAAKLKADGPLILNISFRKNKIEKLLMYVLPGRKQYFHLTANVQDDACMVGMPCHVKLNVTDLNNMPVNAKIELIIKQGSKQITASAAGQGQMDITPQMNDTSGTAYSVLVEHKGLKQQFPLQLNVRSAGYIMNIRKENNTLEAIIHRKNAPDDIAIVLRAGRDMLWSKMLNFESQDSLIVPLPVTASKEPSTSLALFNTSGKLITEQVLPNNYNPLNMQITRVDKDGKAYMAIKVSNQNRKAGNISVSVVARQVIDTAKYTSIQPEVTHTRLMHGWNDILAYNPKGNVSSYSNTAGIWGVVKHAIKSDKPVKVKAILLKNSNGLNVVKVDNKGQFSIPAEMLIVPDGTMNALLLGTKQRENYRIEIKDYAGLFDQRITGKPKGIIPDNTIGYEMIEKPQEKLKDVISLKVVNINAIKDYDWKLLRANYPYDCADYVCEYNILNCPNHKASQNITTKPQLGVEYRYQNALMVYKRCIIPSHSQNAEVKNISVPLDFDKANVEGFGTTVYWQPNVYTDEKGDAYVQVPITSTSIKDYRVVVEGITNELKPLFATQTLKWITASKEP